MIGRFLSRARALFARGHVCKNGPMEGHELILTEYGRSTAWLEVGGKVGRYVMDKQGRLVWEDYRA